jgi:hypothetical protein
LGPNGSHPRGRVPLGDGPAPIIGVALGRARSERGGRRTRTGAPGRVARPWRLGLAVAIVAGSVLTTALPSGRAVAGAADAAVGAAAGTGTPGSAAAPPLAVVAQTAWVQPGQPFDLQLRAGVGTPPVAQLGVSVSVYACLSSVSAFDQSVSTSGPTGSPISSTHAPLAVSGLRPLADGAFDLSMPVHVGEPGPPSTTGFTIDLTSAGQCQSPSGVYPLRAQLVDLTSGQAIGSITTHVVYSDVAPSTQKLRFAVILPVQVPMAASHTTSAAQLRAHPSTAVGSPAPTAVAAAVGTVAAIDLNRSVAVTVDASPQTVASLAAGGRQSGAAVAQLATLAATPSLHQFASAPFAPVNAAGLVNAGLSSELALQVQTGTQTAAALDLRPGAGSGAPLGPWFTNTPVDVGTLTQLGADGYSQVVLPAGSVPGSPTDGSAAEPFQLVPTRGSAMTALVSNSDLVARFTDDPGDPVLAAHQLVAELSQIYYEKPNDDSARGIVAMAPPGWSDSPEFVGALLGALAGNPIIQAVTTAELFNTFAAPSACHNGCKLSAVTAGSGLPVGAIRAQRARIDGFAAAAPAARDLSTQLGQLVLAGEADNLRPTQQAAVLHNTSLAVDAQLSQLVVAGQPITLTSQRGRLPVTIVSNAPYPVTASLTLTSDKLLFTQNGLTQLTVPVVLHPQHANVIFVDVQTRVSGTFRVGIALDAPVAGTTLSAGEITVRSTATSVVGIVLSLGAVLVLVVWWIRTSRKRRGLRRAHEMEAAGTAGEAG